MRKGCRTKSDKNTVISLSHEVKNSPMGQNRAAVVQYMNTKSCFINIPLNWRYTQHSDQIIVFEVKYGGGKSAYFSWSGNNILKKEFSVGDIIEINNVYAHKLGINHGEEVLVKEMLSVPSCQQVWMEPISDDDWEILELNTETVKWQLLNQIRVVWKGQVLPVWINKSVLIYLIVTQLSLTSSVGKLEQFTELYVKPKFRVSGLDLNYDFASPSSKSLIYDSKATDRVSDGSSHLKLKHNDEHLQCITNYTSSSGSVQRFLHHPSSEIMGSSSDEQPSLFRKLSSYFFGLNNPSRTSLMKDTARTIDELKFKARLKEYWVNNIKFSASLRVSPMPDFEHELSSKLKFTSQTCFSIDSRTENAINIHSICLLIKQPTTVFILSRSLSAENLGNDNIGKPIFLGVLTKVLSPTEKFEITSKRNNQEGRGLLSVNKNDFSTDIIHVKVVIVDKINTRCQKACKLLKSTLLQYLRPGRILIPNSIRRYLNLETGCKIFLKSKSNDIISIHKLSACLLGDKTIEPPTTKWTDILASTLSSLTDECCPLVINSETLTTINIADSERDVVISPLEFIRNNDRVFQLLPLIPGRQSVVESTKKLTVSATKNLPLISELDLHKVGLKKYTLGGMNELLEDGLKYLKVALNLSLIVDGIMEDGINCSGALPGAVAIIGPRGSGRTTLAKCLCRELAEPPYFVYSEVADCKQLRGKRPETMYKIWKKMFAQALHKAPSIIVFDDLDHVAGFSSADRTAVDVIQEQVAQIIADFWKTIAPPNSPVVFLVTCTSKESLNSILYSARGCHIIQKFLSIPSLNLEKRTEIIKSLLSSRCSNDCIEKLNISNLVSTIEGVTVQDLKTLVDKTIYSACRKADHLSSTSTTDLIVIKDDFHWALDGFIPSSLKDIKKSTVTKGWDEIGGLKEIKKTLEETFLWPTKFPQLFAQCPVRLSSGLLLYGPPGTGKTLLAAAVATECSLNFISIKGPELLSKYIGASEQAVRDLFRKADSAKPSILFFDEFDAIAPRRGHDSTGVTDRVVNQLLTQMDGIEERKDVYILAATSRPDLIDPALLRPGRLDKCLHCPLPSKEEQLEILQILSRPLTLAPDVDWMAVVSVCDHFSGADLQALLFNAQLLAIHQWEEEQKKDSEARREDEHKDNPQGDSDTKKGSLSWVYMSNLEEGAIDSLPPEKKETLQEQIEILVNNNKLNSQQSTSFGQLTKSRPMEPEHSETPTIATVTQRHLMHAALQMKPSVSPEERERYRLIYESFVHSRSADFSTVEPSIAKKATLA